ncbi:MAG: cupin domain-containing protein [Nitrospira sp.]|nr:cupin domain-containing protein [Nitrospira sp.]
MLNRVFMLTGLIAVAVAAGAVAASEGGGSKSSTLLKSTASWNDIRYVAYPAGQPELTTLRMTIPANAKLDWHRHPMPNTAYILSGTLTIEEKGTGRKATYHAGQSFAESVDNVHRGTTGAEPVVAIVTYAGVSGQPLSIPVPEAGH